MEYNAQIRKEIKAEQKATVISRLGRCLGATALMLLPSFLITLLGTGFMMGSYLPGILAGDTYAAMQATEHMQSGWLFIFLLEMAIMGPLTLGLMDFYIGLMRGEDPSVGRLFHPFSSFRTIWRGIRMLFCVTFRTFLWLLVAYVSLGLLAVAAIMPIVLGQMHGVVPSMTNVVVLFLLAVAFLVLFVLCLIRAIAYLPGYVLMHDDEQIGAWQSTRQAAMAFKGHYKDLLLFFLSFIPWYLLYYGIVMAVFAIMGVAMYTGGISQVGSVIAVVVAYFAMVIFGVLFGGFLSAYQTTSFFSLYEYFAAENAETWIGNREE